MTARPAVPLTLDLIEVEATEKSFQRGRQYYEQKRIIQPRYQDGRLWARCYGSEIYETSVTLTAEGFVDTASCTCPYDWGGICKHQVALLLTYLYQPEQVQEIPSVRELLAERDREALLALIEQMLQREPNLIELLTPRPEPKTATGSSISLDAFRSQIEAQLKQVRYLDYPADLVDYFEQELCLAQETLENGDFIAAGDLCSTFLTTISAAYEDFADMDDESSLCYATASLLDDFRECFALAGDDLTAAKRQEWIQACWLACQRDWMIGGYGYADFLEKFLLELATPDDWQRFERDIQTRLSGKVRDWERRQSLDFLAAGSQRSGSSLTENQATQLRREFGTPAQRALAAADQGDGEAAVAIAREHCMGTPHIVCDVANRLLENGQGDRAYQLVRSLQDAPGRQAKYGYADWLVQYHQRSGEWAAALEWQEQALLTQPRLERYEHLHAIAERLGDWPEVRDRVLQKLADNNQYGMLADIAVLEEDYAEARIHAMSIPAYRRGSLLGKVARAAEAGNQTDVAIEAYQDLAEQHIEGRNRRAYASAAATLQSAQRLARASGREKSWQAYLQALQANYRNLPALQDELQRAKLI